jgi:hypothetical protein
MRRQGITKLGGSLEVFGGTSAIGPTSNSKPVEHAYERERFGHSLAGEPRGNREGLG